MLKTHRGPEELLLVWIILVLAILEIETEKFYNIYLSVPFKTTINPLHVQPSLNYVFI
jgi:hypothetical protein